MLDNYTSTRDLGTHYGEHQRRSLMLIYFWQDFFEELVSKLFPGSSRYLEFCRSGFFLFYFILMQYCHMSAQKVLDLRFSSEVFLNRRLEKMFVACFINSTGKPQMYSLAF